MASFGQEAKMNCKHANLPVKYDPEEAKGLTANEVRAKFPRFYGPCPDCGEVMIGYASSEHYYAGDW